MNEELDRVLTVMSKLLTDCMMQGLDELPPVVIMNAENCQAISRRFLESFSRELRPDLFDTSGK